MGEIGLGSTIPTDAGKDEWGIVRHRQQGEDDQGDSCGKENGSHDLENQLCIYHLRSFSEINVWTVIRAGLMISSN
jgi:hypothetical protein